MKYIVYLICACCLICLSCEETLLTAEERSAKDEKAILEYIAKNNIQNTERTDNGLYYAITEKPLSLGSFPNANSEVVMNYRGVLLDGTEFDSNDSTTFVLGQTIPGWQEGIPKFKKTWKGKLLIPSLLGYQGFPPQGIPANAVLIFDVELLDFQ